MKELSTEDVNRLGLCISNNLIEGLERLLSDQEAAAKAPNLAGLLRLELASLTRAEGHYQRNEDKVKRLVKISHAAAPEYHPQSIPQEEKDRHRQAQADLDVSAKIRSRERREAVR